MKKLITILGVLLLTSYGFMAKAQLTTLYNFLGTANSGNNPLGSLYYDGIFLYGMTNQGGLNNIGTIFKIKPDGSMYDTLMCFAGASNGKTPHGSLISDGTFLYGETQYGGAFSAGTVFKIMPDGSGYLKLYDFDGSTNGKAPFGALYYDGTYMYGMPQVGGANNIGTIFKIKPNGTGYAKLIDFTGNSGTAPGGEPECTLISDGTSLYSTTYNGGTHSKGAIFKFNPTTLVYDTIFSFNVSNGSYPTNSLVYDGTYLYGMTESGGANGKGTIFRIKTDGTMYKDLRDFNGSDGAVPHGGLYYDGTFLYGVAQGGGANSDGIIFKIKPDGTGFIDLYDFDGAAHGKQPFGDLISDGTFLYGFTALGGSSNYGTVFKFQYAPALGIVENNIIPEVSVYPNPSHGVFQLGIRNYQLGIENRVEVYDMLGEKVYSNTLSIEHSTLSIDLTDKPSGIYLYRLSNESGSLIGSGKLVVE